MGWTLADYRSFIQGQVRDSSATLEAQIDRYVNIAGRDIVRMADWRKTRDEGYVVTVAPYTTETVDLTKGSKTVTGNSTVFPSDSATGPRRFALSLVSPWYEVDSRDTDTQLTLAQAYREDDASATAYTLYQDRYTLPINCGRIRGMYLMKDGYEDPPQLNEANMDSLVLLPRSTGVPEAFCEDTPDSNGTTRVRVWPVPDDVYRFYARFSKAWDPLNGPGDPSILPDELDDLVAERALYFAFRARGKSNEAAMILGTFNERLKQEIRDGAVTEDDIQMGQFSSFRADRPLVNYKFPGLTEEA